MGMETYGRVAIDSAERAICSRCRSRSDMVVVVPSGASAVQRDDVNIRAVSWI
jgi:hypothetical protein